MPATPTYPGVYIEELPSSVRTITTVSTSVTAFVGYTSRGPLNTPVVLTSFADFERNFGGLALKSVLSYAVQHFFVNGGSVAIVVRVASRAAAATGTITSGGQAALTVSAKEPGAWGSGLRVSIDADSPTQPGTFNLRVLDSTGAVAETYRNLSLDANDPQSAAAVVNAASSLITVAVASGTTPFGPTDYNGTVSGPLPVPLPDGFLGPDDMLTVTANGQGFPPFKVYDPAKDGPLTSADQLAVLLERKLRAAAPGTPALARAQVHVMDGPRLRVIGGTPDAELGFSGAAAGPLALPNTGNAAATAMAEAGVDGEAPTAPDFIGADGGINALRGVDDVNLLCLPEVADFDTQDMISVLTEAEQLCADKRMMLLVDPPSTWSSLDTIRGNLSTIDPVRSDHAALYLPRIEMTDPLTGRLRAFPPCGAVAGVMARTDAERGVWKAPAGTDAMLTGVQALTVPMTDPENGLLNPLGVNVLRTFPITGSVVWGARTLQGADALASQWKYVPVRRLALMIEESLYRGTKWVVFEPNDERLWGQIRLNVGAFMQTLFRQGAFQGTSARDAYLVKCDKDTTTQNDIDRGVVNIIVGFAPLKPAEFVIIQIEQLAGQIEV